MAGSALAQAQATLAGLGRTVQAIPGDAELALAGMRRQRGRFDVLFADPPRTGMKGAAKPAAALGAPVVVLCSCEPSTLARDLRHFVAAGYRVTRLVLVDRFPQTYHLEAVVRLEATGGADGRSAR